jgi:hypothetical protein
VLFLSISTLGGHPKESTWAKPVASMAATLDQIYEAWKALQGKCKEIIVEYALNDGKQQFCQLWLEKKGEEAEVCVLKNLLSQHIALQGYFHKFFHVSLW